MKAIIAGSVLIILSSIIAAPGQDKASAATKTDIEKPTSIKSKDGNLDGIIIHYTPAKLPEEQRNQVSESTASAAVEALIQMGQVHPEWGIYDRHPDEGGEFSAIGYGESLKGITPSVFRRGFWVKGGMFGDKFDFYPGSVYGVTEVRESNGNAVVALEQCIPSTQAVLNIAPVMIPGAGQIGVEVHHARPTLSNASTFLAKDTAEVAIKYLLKDGKVRPEWGIYKEEADKGFTVLISEGTPLPDMGGAVYKISLPSSSGKRAYQSDGKGNLNPQNDSVTK